MDNSQCPEKRGHSSLRSDILWARSREAHLAGRGWDGWMSRFDGRLLAATAIDCQARPLTVVTAVHCVQSRQPLQVETNCYQRCRARQLPKWVLSASFGACRRWVGVCESEHSFMVSQSLLWACLPPKTRRSRQGRKKEQRMRPKRDMENHHQMFRYRYDDDMSARASIRDVVWRSQFIILNYVLTDCCQPRAPGVHRFQRVTPGGQRGAQPLRPVRLGANTTGHSYSQCAATPAPEH